MAEAFDVIFQDEHIIVINKKAKIVVQPTPKGEKHTLTSLLAGEVKTKVFPCHRLDRETTGVIVYAKTRQIQQKIMDQFRRGAIKKKYIAFIRGFLPKASGVFSSCIIDKQGRRFHEKKKAAKTNYAVLEQLNSFSVVELTPLTGRTNQLRIHLAERGNPILGETVYAYRRDFKVKFKRLALHAFSLRFTHPAINKTFTFTTKLPEDMRVFLEKHDLAKSKIKDQNAK
ncbi:MAG: RluA family pseudouridine synthase [Candidatus Omnitrophota bacterium]